MEILWERRAISDVVRLKAYIAKDNPYAAERVNSAIRQAVGRLVAMPAIGRPERIEGTRELVVPRMPYIVAYRVAEIHVEVLAVIHGAQAWPADL